MRRWSALLIAGGVAALGAVGGCSRGDATVADCRAIFDRIVEIELSERGFRDPALALRKRDELAVLLAPELRRCVGRPLREGALACLRGAKSNEEVSHRCLR